MGLLCMLYFLYAIFSTVIVNDIQYFVLIKKNRKKTTSFTNRQILINQLPLFKSADCYISIKDNRRKFLLSFEYLLFFINILKSQKVFSSYDNKKYKVLFAYLYLLQLNVVFKIMGLSFKRVKIRKRFTQTSFTEQFIIYNLLILDIVSFTKASSKRNTNNDEFVTQLVPGLVYIFF